jgi:hypothetical protein
VTGKTIRLWHCDMMVRATKISARIAGLNARSSRSPRSVGDAPRRTDEQSIVGLIDVKAVNVPANG